MADVGQQQGEVSQAQRLLLCGQAQLGDGPDQGVDDRVQEAQQLAPALQLLGRLRGAGAKICSAREHSHTVLFYSTGRVVIWINVHQLSDMSGHVAQ